MAEAAVPGEVGRPVSVRLSSGEELQGLLVATRASWFAFEVDDRLIEVSDEDVTELRYLDADPAGGWARPGGVVDEDEQSARRGPVVEERIELSAADRVAELGALLNATAAEAGGVHALVRGTHLPGLVSALERFKVPCYALHSTLPRRAKEGVPYLVGLPAGAPWLRSLLKRIAPGGALYVASPAPSREVAAYLSNFLRGRRENGRSVAVRFYDPEVLAGLLAAAREDEAGLLFGEVWCRDPRDGREDLLCPVCDAQVDALARACGACPATFGGDETAPRLITAWLREEREARHVLWRAAPWPTVPSHGRVPSRRPTQRGRKPLVLRPHLLERLAADHRARRRAQGLPTLEARPNESAT